MPQLRRIIYTTNAIESLDAQVRSAPKASSRPSANSALKRSLPKPKQKTFAPLALMLETMNDLWQAATFDENGRLREKRDLALALKACEVAKDCTPYLHPKLARIDAPVQGDLKIELVSYASVTAPTLRLELLLGVEPSRCAGARFAASRAGSSRAM